MSKMQVQMEEWQRFIPGVRMYKGKKTYFYNGEKLWEGDEYCDFWKDGLSLIYTEYERRSWEVIIVLPGVEIIPVLTFYECENVKTVIMADTVKKIKDEAFYECWRLEYIRFSRNLEFIGDYAFFDCALTPIFIPPSCREIENRAFEQCEKMTLLNVPQHTQLGERVITHTPFLIQVSPFDEDQLGDYDHAKVNEWIKAINQEEKFALHRECASIEPSKDNIYEIIKLRGLSSIHVKNQIGLTAFEYLEKNPYTDVKIDEQKLINKYVLDLMGEIVI